MYFAPYIKQNDTGNFVDVSFEIASEQDLLMTKNHPKWQTDWTSDF
jgi:hypothetical protein